MFRSGDASARANTQRLKEARGAFVSMSMTSTTSMSATLMQGLPTSSGPSGSGTFVNQQVKPFHKRSGKGQYRSYAFLPTYLRRIVKYKQMDFEYSFWLMLQLLVSPKTAYRQTTYHKQTKNRWSRDDPAFVVICSLFMAVSASAYCIGFGASVGKSIYTILAAVAVDFILLGVGISSVCWYLANTYLRSKGSNSHTVEQRVEWLYAFDVHCNSYFPVFLALYVAQYLLSPLLLQRTFISSLLSIALYGFSLSYYHYMNFLGYSALPFLDQTDLFLYPIGVICLVAVIAVLFNFNPAIFTLSIYF